MVYTTKRDVPSCVNHYQVVLLLSDFYISQGNGAQIFQSSQRTSRGSAYGRYALDQLYTAESRSDSPTSGRFALAKSFTRRLLSMNIVPNHAKA